MFFGAKGDFLSIWLIIWGKTIYVLTRRENVDSERILVPCSKILRTIRTLPTYAPHHLRKNKNFFELKKERKTTHPISGEKMSSSGALQSWTPEGKSFVTLPHISERANISRSRRRDNNVESWRLSDLCLRGGRDSLHLRGRCGGWQFMFLSVDYLDPDPVGILFWLHLCEFTFIGLYLNMTTIILYIIW